MRDYTCTLSLTEKRLGDYSVNGNKASHYTVCCITKFSELTTKKRLCVYMCMCIRNWPLPIGAFQDQCKQTMINEHSNKHNKVKNPKGQETDQLAIYKRS